MQSVTTENQTKKQTMKSKTTSWLLRVDDYHEFRVAQNYYKQAGMNVKYIELGFVRGTYIACCWIGKKPTKLIAGLIKKYNEEQ